MHKGHTRVTILILCAWSFSILCSIPMLIFRGVEPIVYNNSYIILNGEKLMQCMHKVSDYNMDTLYGYV
jgi:hypothetical protein